MARFYNTSRLTISASTKNFVVQGINVAEKLIGGKIATLPEQVEIKPGNGEIIEANGEGPAVKPLDFNKDVNIFERLINDHF